MATGRVPTTANSPLTAKGDLFGYSTTQARVPVGNDGETLVADSSASTGLRWQGNFSAGKNKILNSDFSIWQRGTSFTLSAGTRAFTADRFNCVYVGSSQVTTVSQQSFTPGTAPVSGYESPFFLRYAVTGTVTGNSANQIRQAIEDVRTFAGQTVTFSFWAKADTNRNLTFYFGQIFGSGGSADVYTSNNTISVTSSWARYSVTVAIPSISGKTIGTGSFLAATLDLPVATTQTIDTWGWQVESGNTATAFQTATGTLAGEFQAAQRYYEIGTSVYPSYATSGGTFGQAINFAVQKRVLPTMTITGVAASRYSNTPTASDIYSNGFTFKEAATSTGDGYFIVSWTASAEL